jgi:hypothetical protein
MKRYALALALCLALVAGAAPLAHTGTQRLALVRVPVQSPEEAALVAGAFDETHNFLPGYVEIVLWPGDAARLAALGFDHEVVSGDIFERDLLLEQAARAAPVPPVPGPDRTEYRRLGDYAEEMTTLAEAHPSLVKLIELPHETLEGRTVLGVEIAAGVKGTDGRPTSYVDGIHHAREWPAGEYPMMFAHHLVEGFQKKNPRIVKVMRRVRTVIIPVVNPDGFDYSRGSVLSAHQTARNVGWPTGAVNGFEGYWRKNRRSFTGATVPVVNKNPDAHGVDVNRNYGFKWGDNQGGSSSSEVSATYRGTEPFSEPETENVRGFLLERNVTSAITNHTYSELVLRPWGDTRTDTPDEGILTELGAQMATAMGGYRNIKSIDLYATTGTTQDWTYGALGALSYTFEHGKAFHPPYATVAESAPGVMEAFMLGAEAASKPAWIAEVKGRVFVNGRPARAQLKIVKRFTSPLWPNNPAGMEGLDETQRLASATGKDGRFTWHLAPSTRPHLVDKGRREAYQLTVIAGGKERKLPVTVGRGGRIDLGDIRL